MPELVGDRRMGALTVVFDLDYTLTDGKNEALRPYAEDLLEDAFSEAAHVVLWTASKRAWCEDAHARLLDAALARVSRRLFNVPCTWTRVLTREHCATSWSGRSTKPLEFLWTSANVEHFIPGIDPARVVLIDDSPIHCAYNAPDSVILVSRTDPHALVDARARLRAFIGDVH